MKINVEKMTHPPTIRFFSLASPEGGEGRGEEANLFSDQIPSPQPSPRLGGERESGTMSKCARQHRTRPRAGLIGRWKLNVQCSMFPLTILFLLIALPLHGQTNTSETNAPPQLSPPYGELPPTIWEQHGTSFAIVGIAIIVLLAFGLWRFLRPKPKIVVPPEVEAREALENLRQQPEDGVILSRISQVVRNYFIAAFQLAPGERTTMEFCSVLAANDKIGAENIKPISDFLHECDAKKFSSSPAVVPLNAAGRALQLIASAEACRLRSAPVPGAATSGGQGAPADRQTQSSSDAAAPGDGRTP